MIICSNCGEILLSVVLKDSPKRVDAFCCPVCNFVGDGQSAVQPFTCKYTGVPVVVVKTVKQK